MQLKAILPDEGKEHRYLHKCIHLEGDEEVPLNCGAYDHKPLCKDVDHKDPHVCPYFDKERIHNTEEQDPPTTFDEQLHCLEKVMALFLVGEPPVMDLNGKSIYPGPSHQ